MLIVTGTKRSGTSMCMQIVQAMGYPALGVAFPGVWGDTIREANELGFYEGPLRYGINFETNPDPKSGVYLHPADTRRCSVKIFARGLVRTDLAYIDAVLMTMRPWREYVSSWTRLRTLEDESRDRTPKPQSPLDAAVSWWLENFALLRELRLRRLPHHVATYDRILRSPAGEIESWFGIVEAPSPAHLLTATNQVSVSQRTQQRSEVEVELPPATIAAFDALYDWFDSGGNDANAMPDVLVERARKTQHTLLTGA